MIEKCMSLKSFLLPSYLTYVFSAVYGQFVLVIISVSHVVPLWARISNIHVYVYVINLRPLGKLSINKTNVYIDMMNIDCYKLQQQYYITLPVPGEL